ncbi:MAG TPA: protein kinase, partial [Thermoanaerobaculia bacterium]|nr:protein kinase [Thermoanaerobaculia bacterium]
DPVFPGSELLQYRLVERIGTSVWRADDSRTGKPAALKILTKQMPKDAARRDEALKQVRLGAALYHSFLVPIRDVVVAGDVLALAMDMIDAQPLTKYLDGKPRGTQEFFRLAYQLADVAKFLQSRNMLHGNITGDAVMVQPNGQVRLGGLNLLNLMPRKEGASSPAYQQRGSDPRSVAYMAPEQISGQAVDFRADVFSIGVVMYEIATGALPWSGTTATDIARAIVEGQPQSPRAINPKIESPVMETIGKCIFKDPFKRQKDARAIVDDIARSQADAIKFAGDLAAQMSAPVAAPSQTATRSKILLLADVDAGESTDPARDAAKMQQVIGEAVYLFDGNVIDPFGAKLVAELPTVDAALEAARKAEFDIEPEQQEGVDLPIRILLHAGDVTVTDGTPTGDALARAYKTLEAMPKRKLYLTEDFVKQGRGNVRLRDAGARAGVKLYEIVPAEPKVTIANAPTQLDTHATDLDVPPPPPVSPKRHSLLYVAAGVLLLGGGVGGMMLSRHNDAPKVVVAPKPAAPTVHQIMVDNFSVEGAEPALLERAAAIRLAVIELLKNTPDVKVIDTAQPATSDAVTCSAAIHPNSPPQFVPAAGSKVGPAAALADNAAGITALTQWIASQVHVQIQSGAPAALNAFADALAAHANNDDAKAETALRAAVAADPNFLSAQLLAMNFFASRGNDKDALAAAKQVLTLSPANVDAARRVARGSLAGGDVPSALTAYGVVLKHSTNDAEALNTIGKYAYSANDAQHFDAAVRRLDRVSLGDSSIHAPDLLLAAGKYEDAAQKYYDIEVNTPNNVALALKIGRIAVLRHTPDIAKIELDKLQKTDPNYGYHLLQAYIAAGQNARGEAEAQLKEARKGEHPGDDYWTSTAEVYAMLGDPKNVITALESAEDRREPTISYVLADPLFTFLTSDAKYQAVRSALTSRQNEIRAALAQIAM